MERVFTNVIPDQTMSFTIDNLKFRVCIQNYDSIGGYAPVIIVDEETNERYTSNGFIILRGHTIITVWKAEYDQNRDNWISSRDLVIVTY